MKLLLGIILKSALAIILTVVVSAVALGISDAVYEPKCEFTSLAGRTVDTGDEWIEFLVVEPDLLRMDVIRDPPGDPDFELAPNGGHVHGQEERFEVTEGAAEFYIGEERLIARAGDVVVVPPNTPHVYAALEGSPVRTIAEFRPALDTGEWFYSFQGKLGQGEMDIWQAAVIQSEFRDGAPWPVDPSPLAWKMAMSVLAPVGRLLGYSACD